MAETLNRFGDIGRERTKVLRVSNKNKEPLLLNGEPIEDVDEFRYIGSIINKRMQAPNKISRQERGKHNRERGATLRLWGGGYH